MRISATTRATFFIQRGTRSQPCRPEGLGAAIDEDVLRAAAIEGRALVTLDLDFANPLRFLPSNYSGIVLLRLRSRPSLKDVLTLVRTLAKFLEREEPGGKLWIVEPGRVRVYQEPSSDD